MSLLESSKAKCNAIILWLCNKKARQDSTPYLWLLSQMELLEEDKATYDFRVDQFPFPRINILW